MIKVNIEKNNKDFQIIENNEILIKKFISSNYIDDLKSKNEDYDIKFKILRNKKRIQFKNILFR